MKMVMASEVLTLAAKDEDVRFEMMSTLGTIRQARYIMACLNSGKVYGNQTRGAEIRADAERNRNKAKVFFGIGEEGVIALNDLCGGQLVDMSGTDEQVCSRFYDIYGCLLAV